MTKRGWAPGIGVGLGLGLAATALAAEGDGPGMTHRMMALVIQVGVIVFAARGGNLLFERLRMPGVVGELLVGVLIGPYLFGAVPLPGFPGGLFDLHESAAVGGLPISPELYGLCAIASVILLFLVGLETDIKLFMRYSLAGTLVGVGGVITSFVVGDVMAMAFGPLLFGRRLGFFDAPCLFLGIISTATSVGITARILSEQHKLDSPEGVTILAAAVIDDVLGIILLAIGMGILAASESAGRINWAQIGQIAATAIGVWLAATAIGLLAARRISRLLKGFRDPSVISIMAMGLALILAGLFEQAGLAMIIGAYVLGLSLSRTDINHVIRERLHPLYVLFVPIFFTVMGMLVDVRLLASPEVLLFGLLYTGVAVLAKVVGCGVPALFAKFNLRGAFRIGVGMLPRGEVTLLIAGTGLAAGLLSPKIFGVVVFMTLFAALISPPLLIALFRHPAPGVRGPGDSGTEAALSFHFPSVQAAELLVTSLLRAFKAEGFFVHVLDHDRRIYQLRKEDAVIGFQHQALDIVFECEQRLTRFVNTAMVEVVAELEQTIKELRKPLAEIEAIGRQLQQSLQQADGRPAATLAGFIARDLLVPRLAANDKAGVIEELLGRLHAAGRVRDLAAAREAVFAREASMSTGMQYGIAIPHGRTDAVSGLVCAIGLKPEGIDFDALDGGRSRIFVLTLSPQSATAPYMQFMSLVSQALDEQGRTVLLACDSADEMYAILTGEALHVAPAPRGAPLFHRLGLGRNPPPTLAAFLRRDLLVVALAGETKEAVIEELLQRLARSGAVDSLDRARQAVLAREAQMSTGLENGIAIPHARTDAVTRMVSAVGVRRAGVDFNSLDGKPAQIIVLTLCPSAGSAPHTQFMALISRALDADGRRRALAADTPDDLWRALVRD